jgi:hypothetical protein
MRLLHRDIKTAGVTLLSAAAAAPVLPLAGAAVDSWAAIPEFDLEFSADGACNLTNTELMAAVAETQVIADDTFTAATTDICTATAHGLESGDGPLRLTTADTLPAGLSLATDYWVIKIDANTFKFAASRANALAGTAVDITDTGTGTHTLSDTADTERLQWASHGLLGQAEDGAISLTDTKRFTQRMWHRPRVVAYSISATLSANNLTVKAFPVAEA